MIAVSSHFPPKQELGAARSPLSETASKMSEPALTYLMPVYNLAAWALLLKQPDDFAFPTALFGAAWALRNTLVWKRLDGGVISMGIVAAAAGAERIYFGGADATMILIEVRFYLIPGRGLRCRITSYPIITMIAFRVKSKFTGCGKYYGVPELPDSSRQME